MALEQYYSVKTLAKMMDMKSSTIYDKIHKGELKCCKFGKSVRISESAKNEWIESAIKKTIVIDVDDLIIKNKMDIDIKTLLNKE